MPKLIAEALSHRLGGAGIALLRAVADIAQCPMRTRAIAARVREERGRCLEVTMSDRPLISIVDDDQPYRDSIEKLVRLLGYTVEGFSSAAEFLGSHLLPGTSCLVADVHMPGMTGIELHERLVALGHKIPTMLVTAYPDPALRDRALKAGVLCYLSKPVDDYELEQCLRTALNLAPPI